MEIIDSMWISHIISNIFGKSLTRLLRMIFTKVSQVMVKKTYKIQVLDVYIMFYYFLECLY